MMGNELVTVLISSVLVVFPHCSWIELELSSTQNRLHARLLAIPFFQYSNYYKT